MELFKEYVKEREGCETLVVDGGFLTARLEHDKDGNNFLFINDFFVSKESRIKPRTAALKLINIAKSLALKNNCSYIQAVVWLNTENATESLKANLYYGFTPVAAMDNKILVQSDLKRVMSPMSNDN